MTAIDLPSFSVVSALWTDEDFAAITQKVLSMGPTDLTIAAGRLPSSVLRRIIMDSKYAAYEIAQPSAILDQHDVAIKRFNAQKCASAQATFLAMAGQKFACFGDRLKVSMKIDVVTKTPLLKVVETKLKICLGDDVVADVVSECSQIRGQARETLFTKFATNFPCEYGNPTPREWNDAICTFFGDDTETAAPAKKRKRTE